VCILEMVQTHNTFLMVLFISLKEMACFIPWNYPVAKQPIAVAMSRLTNTCLRKKQVFPSFQIYYLAFIAFLTSLLMSWLQEGFCVAKSISWGRGMPACGLWAKKKKIRKKLIKNIYIKKQTKVISLFIIDYTIQFIVKNIKITKKKSLISQSKITK